MRPFRSFLLLLIFLTCLIGLYYLFPASKIFPSIKEFVPVKLLESLSGDTHNLKSAKLSVSDSMTAGSTVTHPSPKTLSSSNINPLSQFLDSLANSKGQVRVMYYGDSQIEGDRITFSLRNYLRVGRSGSGPGLFLPVMPVMYTRSVWLSSSSNWKRYNYLSSKRGRIAHNKLGPFMTICRYMAEGEIASVPQKAYVKVRSSGVSDHSAPENEILRIFYGNTPGIVSIRVKENGKTSVCKYSFPE